MTTASAPYHATDGAAYQRFLGRWTAQLAQPLLDFADLPADGAWADIGCGTGSLALAMARRRPGASVHGIDRAAPYLDFAKTQDETGSLVLQLGDAMALPCDDGAFSGVAAQLVLNFVADPLLAASEMRRVLRPGGIASAAVWDFRGGLVYQRIFWDSAAALDPGAAAARDKLFSAALALPEGLPNLWRRAGFAEVAQGSLTIRMDYADFDDYWEPLLGGQGPVGTYVTGLTATLRAAIRESVRAAYLSGATDGPRSLTATAWAVRGVAPS